ncbi:MAG TPA: tetratricopeptide repeat protein, partial [Schlesneria sp.]
MTTASLRLFIQVLFHRLPRQHAVLSMLLVVGIQWSTCAAPPPRPKAAKADAPAKQQTGKGMPKGYEKIVAVTFPSTSMKTEVDGTLVREIARQALLVAAEQELGLITLDSSIGEVIPVGDVVAGPFIVTSVATRNQIATDALPLYDFNVSITRFNPTGAAFLWTAPTMDSVDSEWIQPFVEHMEHLSRTDLVKALEKAGYEKPKPSSVKAKAPTKIEDHFDFVTQFGLIQSLHVQLRIEETPELLGRLVRAYANIGSLTDYHWSPASKAFKARALIYAQRLVSKYDSTPFALAHRAYALALTGRHADALNDIAAADDATGMEAPDWLKLITAYCMFDAATLKAENTPHPELALYLRVSATSMDYGMDNANNVSQKFIAINPACGRTMDLLIDSAGFASKRWVTEIGFNAMWPHVHYRLLSIPGLPGPARTIADRVVRGLPKANAEYEQRKELVECLQTVTSVKETPGPSWPVLADLLRDAAFCQAWQVLDVQTNTLGIDSTPTLQAMNPVVKGHRMENFLSLLAPDYSGVQLRLNSAIDNVDRESFQAGAFPLVAMLWNVGETEQSRVQRMIQANLDPIYEDALREMMEEQSDPQRRLSDISPHWPASIVDSIRRDPDPQLKEYEEEHGKSMIVMRSIADKHLQLKHHEDAIRCWKKVAEVTKSCADNLALSQAYRAAGQMDLWAETMQKALTLPDLRLQHAGIRGNLAEWFIDQQKWDEAAPHVKKAAESYSNWGLSVGAKWAEGTQDWDQAEIYMRDLSTRYAESAADYFYWCLRNNRGDRSLARRILERHLYSRPKPVHWIDQAPVVIALVADDDRVGARKLLHEIFEARKNVPAAIHEALLADEDGDTDRRDALFREIENTTTNQASFRELVGCFRGVLSGTEDGQWNPHVMDMLVAKTPHADA